MHLSEFWPTLLQAAGLSNNTDPNPSVLCKYTFELARQFMAWLVKAKLAKMDGPEMASKSLLSQAIGKVLKACLNALGIEEIQRT
jgi:arginyl-tRNA synthetase